MNVEEFRSHGHIVIDVMADYLAGLSDGPPWRAVPDERRALLADQPLPDNPIAFEDILEFATEHILPHPFGNGHPRFFGWGNPPPALEGVLADLIASAMNPSCAGGDQAAIYLEKAAVRWLAELVGFPGDGVLVSGGAAAALTALTAARHRAAIEDGWDDLSEGFANDRGASYVLYVSDESHSCQHKAARVLGIGDHGVHLIPTDRAGRMHVEALEAAVRADRAAGLRPFCAVASAGVVSTGAVDDLFGIAEICANDQLWFHIDGSLGGFGILDPRRTELYAGLALADSLTLDPHKWLSVPIDCAVVLTRELEDLRSAFSLVPPYLRARPSDLPWFSEYVFDQTRPFRALRLWATIASAGRKGLARRVARNVDQATRLARQIDAAPDLELMVTPALNIVTFRHLDGGDELNRALPVAVQQLGEVFVTGARVDGAEVVRVCFMHVDTTDDDVDQIVPAVLRAANQIRTHDRSP